MTITIKPDGHIEIVIGVKMPPVAPSRPITLIMRDEAPRSERAFWKEDVIKFSLFEAKQAIEELKQAIKEYEQLPEKRN